MKKILESYWEKINVRCLDVLDWIYTQYNAKPMPTIGIALAIYTVAVILLWEVLV